MSDNTRYSEEELQEFKELIESKLKVAREELKYYQDQIRKQGEDGGDTEYKFTGLDEGSITQEKEYLNQMAARQLQFISHLENALLRIQNGTYGVCRVSGKLISKQRLRVVPHATLSIEAKTAQKK